MDGLLSKNLKKWHETIRCKQAFTQDSSRDGDLSLHKDQSAAPSQLSHKTRQKVEFLEA